MLNDSHFLRVLFTLGKWVGLYHYDKCETSLKLRFSRTSYVLCATHFIFSILYLIMAINLLLTKLLFKTVFNRILVRLLMVETIILIVKPVLVSGMQLMFSKKIMDFLNRVLLQCRLMNVDFSQNEQISKCLRRKRNLILVQIVLFFIEISTFIDEPLKIDIVFACYTFWYLTIYRSIFVDGGLLLCLGFRVELNETLNRIWNAEKLQPSDEDFSYISMRLKFLIKFKNWFHKFFSFQIFCISFGSVLLFLSPIFYIFLELLNSHEIAASSKLKNLTDRLTIAAIYAVELYSTFTILETVLHETRKTRDILFRLKLTDISNSTLKRNVELLYLQLYQETIFQTKELFKINRETLAGVFASLVSHVIILIQFQLDCVDGCLRQ